MPLFVTYITDTCDDPVAISLEDFVSLPDDWCEFVWQEAPDASTAASQHFAKHDEWYSSVVERDEPEKKYY